MHQSPAPVRSGPSGSGYPEPRFRFRVPDVLILRFRSGPVTELLESSGSGPVRLQNYYNLPVPVRSGYRITQIFRFRSGPVTNLKNVPVPVRSG